VESLGYYTITYTMAYTVYQGLYFINPNKYDSYHIHMDYVILYGFTEGK